MIEYALPDFTDGMALNSVFLDIQANNPELMMDDVRIGSVYGCFPGCLLNGGRAQLSAAPYSPQQMEAAFALLDGYGVKARLTLTNMVAEKHHLDDPYFQQIMTASQGHGVEAIVSLDVVDTYVQEKYPDMPRILSTTCEILNVDDFNNAIDEYDYVVLNYTKHRDTEFLSRITHPEKVEVMANEFCRIDCPSRVEHYRRISEDQICGEHSDFPCSQPATQEMFSNILNHVPNHPVILTNEDVRHMHDTYGIENFKLVGRGMSPTIIHNALMYYLIKPEHYEAANARMTFGISA